MKINPTLRTFQGPWINGSRSTVTFDASALKVTIVTESTKPIVTAKPIVLSILPENWDFIMDAYATHTSFTEIL